MVCLRVTDLKNSPKFIREIRWDVSPRIFMEPQSGTESTPVDVTHGYMLYVDLMENRPAVVIMQLKRIMSKTVGYINDVPEELLKDSMQCSDTECVAGMYPLSEKLTDWLKKELGEA